MNEKLCMPEDIPTSKVPKPEQINVTETKKVNITQA